MARSRARTLAIARVGDGPLRVWRAAGLLILAAFLVAAHAVRADDAASPKIITSHGISSFGDLKYPADFKHFDFVNPDAPKGGTMSFRGTGASQTFDSLNAFILKGEPAQGLGLLYDSLLTASPDEPDAAYGLIASTLEYPEDRSWVIFNMRPEAKFSDGVPITADDVVFTWKVLLEKGEPSYQITLKDIETVEALDPHRVKFTFKPGASTRDLPGARRRPLDPAQALLRHRRIRRLDPDPAGRLRPVRHRRRQARQVDQVLPQPRLLGRGPAGQRRRRQLRLLRLRVFRRQHRRLRGAQGRRLPLPRGILLRALGHRLRLPGDPERLGQARGDPRPPPLRHPGLLDEPAPREAPGPPRPRGDRADVQLRMVERDAVLRPLRAHHQLLAELADGCERRARRRGTRRPRTLPRPAPAGDLHRPALHPAGAEARAHRPRGDPQGLEAPRRRRLDDRPRRPAQERQGRDADASSSSTTTPRSSASSTPSSPTCARSASTPATG